MSEQLIEKKLSEIFGFLDVSPEVEITPQEEEGYNVFIEGPDLNFLIGRYGRGLDALQTILGLMLFKETGEWIRNSVDINGYRQRRVEKLQDMAKGFIDRVRFFQNEVMLPPMAPWERRHVHIFISEYEDIESESVGEGRDRRVTLRIK